MKVELTVHVNIRDGGIRLLLLILHTFIREGFKNKKSICLWYQEQDFDTQHDILTGISIQPPFWSPIFLHWGRWRPNAECICIINSLDKFVVSKARVWYPTWHTFWKFNFTPFLPAPLPPGPPQKVGLESTKWKILLGASISTQTIQHIPNSANSDNPVNAQLLFYRPLYN